MKITIIGAGIAGLTVAIALRKYRPDLELEIFESSLELRPAGAGLALGANAILGFEELGVKDEVLEVSNVLHFFKILDPAGRVITKSDNLAINRNLKTVSNFAVHRADLQRVLLAQIPEVPVHLNKKVWDFRRDEEGVQIRFADGTGTASDFVLAADGIHSIFRQMLLPKVKTRFAGYTCWRGVAEGRPVGLSLDVASETWGPGRRFGIVPLADGQVYWFACLNVAREKDERMAGFGKKELAETFRHFHAPVADLIDITGPSKILWNDILDFPPAGKFAFGRVLLLGDAAHATTPNMGQGACQAIEGAVILGKMLARIEDPLEAFPQFEQVRLKRTAFVTNRSWQLGKIAQLDNRLLAGLRNFLFRRLPERLNEQQVRQLLDVEF